jgi:CheY-like chemotaxis protein
MAGYTVFVAPDGKPALERMRTHPAGLVVLLDLMMPGMDGCAVLQALAADVPLAAKHACLLMTAAKETLPGRVRQLLQQLQVPVVAKPFDLDRLLQAVEQAAAKLP